MQGSGGCGYRGDGGPATLAALDSPASVAIDGANNLYIADTNNCRVRKVSGGSAINSVQANARRNYSGLTIVTKVGGRRDQQCDDFIQPMAHDLRLQCLRSDATQRYLAENIFDVFNF